MSFIVLNTGSNILRLLVDSGCKIKVVPADYPVDKVLEFKPDGVFLSNGPGDPKACDYAIQNIRELLKNKIYKFTVSNALGQGKEVPITEVYRGIAHEISLLKKVRLEIAVNDEYVDNAVDSIIKVAQGAKDKGRGKIFILPVEECIRLRTNERGKEAIG